MIDALTRCAVSRNALKPAYMGWSTSASGARSKVLCAAASMRTLATKPVRNPGLVEEVLVARFRGLGDFPQQICTELPTG